MSEKEKINFGPETGEKPIEVVDIQQKKEHLSGEVADWMQRVETNQIQTDLMGDLVKQANSAPEQKREELTKLPISKPVFVEGFKSSINEAHRWLSEFMLRLIKIKKGKVQFKEE